MDLHINHAHTTLNNRNKWVIKKSGKKTLQISEMTWSEYEIWGS
jgi:uncharacterized C2H2 Zn-finger protein